jgi:hypothetical protein
LTDDQLAVLIRIGEDAKAIYNQSEMIMREIDNAVLWCDAPPEPMALNVYLFALMQTVRNLDRSILDWNQVKEKVNER